MSAPEQDGRSSQRRQNVMDLVHVLTEIHNKTGQNGGTPLAGRPAEGGAPADKPIDLLMQLTELVIKGSTATNQAILNSLLGPQASPAQRYGEDRYSSLQTHFANVEHQLREHARLVDRILSPGAQENGNAATDNAAKSGQKGGMVQQTVYLRCPRGGKTGGRVRYFASDIGTSGLEIRKGPVRSETGGNLEAAIVKAWSDRQMDSPAGGGILKIEFDIGSCDTPDDRAETWIELLAHGHTALRIWLEVEIHD